ncbi:putative toxin [Microbacterium sp. SZ1]|uniref:putative toxin n=1 Tax=Microbacterium sp. SZ1 TaxID=1849736 RepID=UPI000BBC810C|nr:putative toxin [Microbacterium sp. SZ1]
MAPRSARRLRFAPARRLPFALAAMVSTVAVVIGLFQPVVATADTAPASVPEGFGLYEPATDPAGVVRLFTDGGPSVQAAARDALAKGEAAVDEFIANGQALAIDQDYRIVALRLSMFGGREVREQAEAALDSTDPAVIRAFVSGGWQDAWIVDERSEAYILAGSGTPTVSREAEKALDSDDPNAVSEFIRSGQYDARIIDDRSAAYVLASSGSPSVAAAAEEALGAMLPDGSDDAQAVADFLRYGQFVAAARDAETASITQLTQQAIDANAIAQEERLKADEASAQAVLAARLAKEATERAAAEANAAQGEAQKANAAAGRAASLASQAADAADTAVQAAAAAHQAMNASMSAAGTAASAAARAQRAAANANSAAASAAGQEQNAAAARAAAEQARTAAGAASTASRASSEADKASGAATRASNAANAAAGYSGEAAGWATEASQASGVSSAAAAQARAAASKANAAKDRAASATARVDQLASQTSQVAQEARDAASRAADHANAAAIEADTAANQASISQGAATRATASAAKAETAATEATKAVDLAKRIFDLARKADAERLAAEEEYGMERARESAAEEAEALEQQEKEEKKAADAVAESSAFLEAISQPDADLDELLPEARSALLALITTGTAWVAAGAEQAVVGSDEAVVEYFTEGYPVALEQDQWDEVKGYLYGTNEQLRVESYDILENGEEFVAEFLAVDVPAIKDLDNRQTAFVLAQNGGAEVQRQANAALDADDPAALAEFIEHGQYDALAIDQRAEAFILSGSGGPELQAAANIALEGSNADLRVFLERGRYEAEKRDNATAAHVAQMQSMLQLADSQASASREAAAKAAEAAAIARNAAAEAQASAAKAQQYAQQAQSWAAQAAESANQATASENQAKQSQQRAHQALTRAIADAKVASSSAARATASAQQAQGYAADAAGAAARAAQSATNAGLSATAAAQAATDAQNIAAMMQRAEDASNNFPPPADQRGDLTQAEIDAAYAAGGDAEVQRLKDAHALTQPNAFMDMIIKEGGQLLLDVLGVTDIMNCVTKGDFGACVMSIIGFAPWGKVAKLLGSIPLIAKIATKVIGFADKVKDAFSLIRKNDGRVDDIAGAACSLGRSTKNCGPFDPEEPTFRPGDSANVKGQKGETAAGIPPGGPKTTFSKADYPDLDLKRDRIPDAIGDDYLMEVKNVNSQYYSSQIKDDVKIAEQLGLSQVVLAIRPDTKLTGPLVEAICAPLGTGVEIVVKHLPATVGGELSGSMRATYCK